MAKFNIILFDGVCNLCNSSVNFIIDHDKKNLFKFASIQSDTGRNLLEKFMIQKSDELKTVMLIEGDKLYSKSTAILKIAKEFGGFWKLLYAFIIVPKPVRDFFYDIVSRNRYKWFGKIDSCRMPDAGLKEKFL